MVHPHVYCVGSILCGGGPHILAGTSIRAGYFGEIDKGKGVCSIIRKSTTGYNLMIGVGFASFYGI